MADRNFRVWSIRESLLNHIRDLEADIKALKTVVRMLPQESPKAKKARLEQETARYRRFSGPKGMAPRFSPSRRRHNFGEVT